MLKFIFERHVNFALPLTALLGILFMTGCGGKFPKVTGKITHGGKPVPNLKVIFTPIGGVDNPIPGPYSTGVTDASGSYSLRTRRKDIGAVAGPHRVGFEWADNAGDDVEYYRDAVRREKDATRKAEFQAKLKEIRASMKSRPKVPKTLEFKFEVPEGGTSEADFEVLVQ